MPKFNSVRDSHKSLAVKAPEVAAQWHPTKNGDLTPADFAAGSNQIVWWRGRCRHEWDAKGVDRTAKKRGCPFCSGKRIALGFNDLCSAFPGIAAEWHPTKNEQTTPESVHPGSEKKVWWLGKCGHEW